MVLRKLTHNGVPVDFLTIKSFGDLVQGQGKRKM